MTCALADSRKTSRLQTKPKSKYAYEEKCLLILFASVDACATTGVCPDAERRFDDAERRPVYGLYVHPRPVDRLLGRFTETKEWQHRHHLYPNGYVDRHLWG